MLFCSFCNLLGPENQALSSQVWTKMWMPFKSCLENLHAHSYSSFFLPTSWNSDDKAELRNHIINKGSITILLGWVTQQPSTIPPTTQWPKLLVFFVTWEINLLLFYFNHYIFIDTYFNHLAYRTKMDDYFILLEKTYSQGWWWK